MDANHQDKRESKLSATEDKLWLPPLSPKDQKKLKQLQRKSFAERTGVAGKTPIGVKNAVIDLSNADLSNDDLRGAYLNYTDLNSTDLSNADLRDIRLPVCWISSSRLAS